MDIFQRTTHSNVKRLDEDLLQVSSSLLDLEHSFHLELTVRLSTRTIEAAKAAMSKTPLPRCLRGVEGIPALAGLRVERGVIREIHDRLGGRKGCTHLVELLTDALRLISMILIGNTVNYWDTIKGTMTEEEIIAEGMDKLRDTCLVFAEHGQRDK